MEDTIISNSPDQTVQAGRRLAEGLRSGDVVALCGNLGAGKTHFTKGLVAGLGGDPDQVSSPTFSLAQEYTGGRFPIVHLDLYRLDQEIELRQLGWWDYLDQEAVLLVEWANKFPEALPRGTIFVRFEIGAGDHRIIQIER
jgi:tRNA threonylcarbamoyladenosine biosynthesis protein TsaE